MAGGSGERFWPVSTKTRPKQFLRLTDPEQSLLQEAVGRAIGLFGAESTIVATGQPFAVLSQKECPNLPNGNVWAEPAKRNTTGCQVWVAANLIANHPTDWSNITIAVLTADHRITPPEGFNETVLVAMAHAEATGSLVTIGIRPNRPETGYGYIELGEPVGAAHAARAFREKPDLETANRYLASGNYLWNSGMFFWTLPAFMTAMESTQPAIAALVREIAGHLKTGDETMAKAVFETLPSISIDYALMENADNVAVVEARFDWDDLGAWDSLRRSFERDESNNVSLGSVQIVETSNAIVYNESSHQRVNLLGLEGIVVVVTDDQVMVCPADRTQDVRKLTS